MKPLRKSIFLPLFALIAFLGLGAGTVLADSSNEGVGGWSSEAVGTGQVSIDLSGSPDGIDGSGDARFTSDATGSEPKRRAFVGTLSMPEIGRLAIDEEIDVGSITVKLQTPGEVQSQVIDLLGDVTVGVNGLATGDGGVECEICRFPGGDRAGTFTENARVVVLAEETERGYLAVWVLFKPVRPPETSTGLVVGVDGGEVTIETPNGEKKTVTLPEHAKGVGPGEVITVFRGNSGEAKGVVRAEKVKGRLEKFLNDAEAEVDAPEGDEDGKGRNHDKAAAHIARIDGFLEGFNNRRTQLIDGVIGGAPEGVKAKLVEVRERIHAQRLAHRETIGRIWAKLDRVHPAHSHRGGSETADQPRPERVDQNQAGERPTSGDGQSRGRVRGQDGSTDTP